MPALKNHDCRDALGRRHEIQGEIAVVELLKVCASQKDLRKGRQLHADALKRDLIQTNIFIGNTLVNLYVTCGALPKARQVFDELPFWDLVSWNAVIKGYSQHGHGAETLNCFKHMQQEGFAPDVVSFACMLKACGSIGAAAKGEEIHAEIVREGLQNDALMLSSALISMYTKCGVLVKAQQLFEELPIRNVVSWTALIGGYCQQGKGEIALDCFSRMKSEGLSPDAVTFACILKACSSMRALERGEKIHGEIIRCGFLRENPMLGNALVDMYTKFGAMAKAQEVFDELRVQNVISWTTLIGGYCDHGQGEEALDCFARMLQKNLSPNVVTFACVLKACGTIGAVKKGLEIHVELVRQGFAKDGTMLGNALLDMYAKCGALGMAKQAFDELPIRDVVSWNTLITGYCECRLCEEALSCFDQMRWKGYSPNTVTYACILRACGNIGATDRGKEIHSEICRNEWLEDNIVLGNALVDMYAKCGALNKAQLIFNELKVQDVVSWTALIGGYCEHGHAKEALECFEQMKQKGPPPNAITFICILKACGSIGAIERGQQYFESMSKCYGIVPNSEHYSCMVVLFSRAGCFDKAMAVIENIASPGCLPAWFALLGACQKWENVQLGRLAYEHATRSYKTSAAPYACMSNIYTALGMQEDVGRIESLRLRNDACLMEELGGHLGIGNCA